MRDILIRALKTFLQAAMGYVCTIGVSNIDFGKKTAVTGIAISAIAAGFSALMNIDWDAADKSTTEGETEHE